MKSSWAIAFFALLAITDTLLADHIDAKITPSMQEYCHIVRFLQGWKVPTGPGEIFLYDYYDKYEFRVLGLLETKFLIAGHMSSPREIETTTKYQVDLSDPKAPALAASEETWQSATRLRFAQQEAGFFIRDRGEPRPVEFHGFQFAKSGRLWAINNSRISPDKTWIVLQSYTGTVHSSDGNGLGLCFPFGCRGKVFFDIYNGETGKKLMTIEGSYSGGDPNGLLSTTGWLTERYFIVALGEHRERCLVCDFGKRSQIGSKQ